MTKRNNYSRVPEYWSKHKSLRHVRHKSGCVRVKLSSRSVWYKEVSRLVMKTWEDDKVGQGSDAAGLRPHGIRIRNIFCIENPRLYNRYITQKQVHCSNANRYPCPKIHELQNERRVRTSNLSRLRTDSSTMSTPTANYQWENKTAKGSTDHAPSYAQAKKMKWITLHILMAAPHTQG